MTKTSDGPAFVEEQLFSLRSAQAQGLTEATIKLAWRLLATNPDHATKAEASLALAIGACRSPNGLIESSDHVNYAQRYAARSCADSLLIVRCLCVAAEIERHLQNIVGWEKKVAEAAHLGPKSQVGYGYVSLIRGRKLLSEGKDSEAEQEFALAAELFEAGVPVHITAIAVAHLAFARFTIADPPAYVTDESPAQDTLKLFEYYRDKGVVHPTVTKAWKLLRQLAHHDCGLTVGPAFRNLMWI